MCGMFLFERELVYGVCWRLGCGAGTRSAFRWEWREWVYPLGSAVGGKVRWRGGGAWGRRGQVEGHSDMAFRIVILSIREIESAG